MSCTLQPDAKSQVTLRYANGKPVEATQIVLSTQHSSEDQTSADIRKIAAELGLKLTAVQGVGTPSANDTQHEATLERFKNMGQLVHDLCPERPPLIETVLGGRDPWEKMKPLFVRRLADWVKVAEAWTVRSL